MKKITLLLTAVFVLSVASMYAQQYNPDSDFMIDWDRDVKDTIKITKYVGSRSEVRIPPEIQNNTVNRIGMEAFARTNITSVIIPNGVTIIESNAFERCTRLTSVTIPNSVKIIYSSTFSDCTSLISVTIPASVTRIDNWAFTRCTSLTSVTIPASVTRIGMFAFTDCINLTSVTFQGEPDIHYLAFDGNLDDVFSGIGTYTRFAGGKIWKANFTPAETAARQRAEAEWEKATQAAQAAQQAAQARAEEARQQEQREAVELLRRRLVGTSWDFHYLDEGSYVRVTFLENGILRDDTNSNTYKTWKLNGDIITIVHFSESYEFKIINSSECRDDRKKVKLTRTSKL